MPVNIYKTNRVGKCPYCGKDNYDGAKTEERNPAQVDMYCNDCDRWSVRQGDVQYPLQDPTDQTSSPATVARVDET